MSNTVDAKKVKAREVALHRGHYSDQNKSSKITTLTTSHILFNKNEALDMI